MVMCSVCGAGNSDTAKFCNECGKALSAEGAAAAPTVRTPVSQTVVLSPEPTPVAGETIAWPSPQSTAPPAYEPTMAAPVERPAYEPTVAMNRNPAAFEPTVRGEAPGSRPVPVSEPTMRAPINSPSEPTIAYTGNRLEGIAPLQPVGRTVPATPSEPTVAVPPTDVTVRTEPTPPTMMRPTGHTGPEQPGAFPDFRQSLDRIQRASSLTPTVRKADILFVVDCTGSMQGEIDAIRDTISDFVTEIERDGIRVRVGLLAFGDRFNGEESFVFRFAGETFTKDATVFRHEIYRLRAGGGGDIPESSLDALLLATRQPFAQDASRVIVLVTDAPPHIPDVEAQSVAQVGAAIQAAGIKQLYLVIRTQDPTSGVYLSLLEGTQGLAFELGSGENFRSRAENFKKTLRALGRTISTGTR